jgi:hypothetical protein
VNSDRLISQFITEEKSRMKNLPDKSGLFNILMSTIFLLALSPLANAKQTFYNSLDSKEAVEDGGGTVHGGSFEPGVLEQGYLADDVGEAVSFPTEGILQLDEGTIALWVKVMFPILDAPKESFIFLSYFRGTDAWFINP